MVADPTGPQYWDPAASSLKKAQDIVNAEGYTGPALAADNSNYFEITSANYIGTTQTAQFTRNSQINAGWGWISKCTAVGVCNNSEPVNNEFAEIPRAYDNDNPIGVFYNWYAATAESGTYAMTSGDASDSVCPSGWQLPLSRSSNIDKSWINLIFGSYHYNKAAEMLPLQGDGISMMLGGYHTMSSNLQDQNLRGVYWTSTVAGTSDKARLLNIGYAGSTDDYIGTESSYNKPNGLAIRCVLK